MINRDTLLTKRLLGQYYETIKSKEEKKWNGDVKVLMWKDPKEPIQLENPLVSPSHSEWKSGQKYIHSNITDPSRES